MRANTFHYFAYGSNMLTPRLAARCPSAEPLGVVSAKDWRVGFSQRSRSDGSGKASLMQSKGEIVHGVLFEIAVDDRDHLDAAEGAGYGRIDNFEVHGADSDIVTCATYIANKHEDGLKPYDWYLALIIAGACEHGLHQDYQERLRLVLHEEDTRPQCRYRDAALEALQAANYRDVTAVLSSRNS